MTRVSWLTLMMESPGARPRLTTRVSTSGARASGATAPAAAPWRARRMTSSMSMLRDQTPSPTQNSHRSHGMTLYLKKKKYCFLAPSGSELTDEGELSPLDKFVKDRLAYKQKL